MGSFYFHNTLVKYLRRNVLYQNFFLEKQTTFNNLIRVYLKEPCEALNKRNLLAKTQTFVVSFVHFHEE